jgi:cobalt-precorrin-7 (C5)-methyltransferase
MNKVCIAGIGPGSLDYVTPAALKAVQDCDLLVGGKRNLASFQHLEKETFEFKSSLEDLYLFVERERNRRKICVIVSGDPGFFSLLDFFLKKFKKDALEVIPGISSFQYLFCKMAQPWKNYALCSMHGRDTDLDQKLAANKGVFLLTDRDNNPGVIAAYLIEHGFSEYVMTVGENLSYPEERIVAGKPAEIIKDHFSNLCVVVIEKNGMEI